MENTSHNVPQWQRTFIVSDDSIFEDFGPLRPNPVPVTPTVAPAAVERSLRPMDQVKQRTRRLLKPIVRGNNQHGRMGKRRCLQCRTWKQKCEYVNIADPCKVCLEKGLRCTASDKIWGNARRLRQAAEGDRGEIQAGGVEWTKDQDGVEEIPRQPPTPDENMLGPVDGALLQFYLANLHNDFFYFEEVLDAGPCWRSEPLGHDVWQRFGPTLASMAVRNAVILLSLRRQQRRLNNQSNDLLEMEYKDRFYGAMRNAIRERAYTDVLYASYFACLWGLIDLRRKSKSSRDDFIKHLNGFSSVLITLAPVFTATEILSTFGLLGNLIQWTVYYADSSPRVLMGDIFQPLEAAYIALESANRSVPQGCRPAYGHWSNLITDFSRMWVLPRVG